MDKLKPWFVLAAVVGPPIAVICYLDTPEAAGARAGILVAIGLFGFFTLVSFLLDGLHKSGGH